MSYRRQGLSPIWVLIIVNAIIFIATLINETAIYDRFGLLPSSIGQEPWTLFTYMFVHSTAWTHIFFNMLTLYFFGTFVMSLVGETAFLLTYFVGGIVAGLFFLGLAPLTHATNTTVVGASGAIYSLGGFLMAMRPSARVVTFPIPVPLPLWVAVLIGFVLVSFLPGVAWQAHLGGIVYGLLIGYYYRRREIRRY